MKVLVLTKLFPQSADDATGVFIYRRTAALARRCEVRVVSPRTERGGAPRERLGEVEVVRPRWRRIPKAVPLDGYFYAASVRPVLERVRQEFDFDVIDAHFIYPDGYAAVRLGRELGRPVVVWARGADGNKLCFWWPTRRLARAALRGADRLVGVSASLREKMIAAGAEPQRVRVIANGVDAAVFHPGPADAARRALGLPGEGRVVFSAGALIPRKGYAHVLRGFAPVAEARDAHLYIAGQGPERDALLRLAADLGVAQRVTLLGRVPPDAIGEWYRAADVFCLGSLSEGCPNVVREALASGTPAVATRVDGTPELFDGDYCGLLVPPADGAALAEALDAALSRRWDRGRIAASPAARSWDDAAAESLAVFEDVLASRREGVAS